MTVRAVSVRDQTVRFEGAIAVSGTDESRFSRKEALAIRLARALADRPFRLNSDLLTELRTEYRDDEIIEMIFCCAIFSWGNIIGIATRRHGSRRTLRLRPDVRGRSRQEDVEA